MRFAWLAGCMTFLLLPARPGRAGDLQVWNTTEFAAVKGKRWSWEVFGAVRARDHVTAAYDERLGSQLRVSLAPRLNLQGGYLRRWVDPDHTRFHAENRLFLSSSVLLARLPLRVEWVSLYERHIAIPGRTDFNRYKQRLDLERTRRRVSPFVWEELTFCREGFVRSRTLAGVRWRFPSGARFEIGYQYEKLKVAGLWAPRHTLRTTLNLGVLVRRS